jgi:hypothetical protein
MMSAINLTTKSGKDDSIDEDESEVEDRTGEER